MRIGLAHAAGLQLFVLTGLAMGQTAPPPQRPPVLTFIGSFPLAQSGRIDHMSVDLESQRMFVSVFGNNTLEVIDLKTGKQINEVKSLNKPQNSYYVASTNRLFVASQGDGTVKVFDGMTYALQRTVQLSSDADNVRYDARRHHVLIDYGGEKFMNGRATARQGMKDGGVAVLDDNGNKVADIPTSGHPESLQPEEKGDRIFISSPDDHYIVVGDLNTNKVLAHWSNPKCENHPMALDEGHHRLFVFCRGDDPYVSVIDTESGKQVATIPPTPHSFSDDLFYDPGKSRLYVLSTIATGTVRPGIIDVIQQQDADHYERIATYATASGAQTGVLVPELGKLFVASIRQPTGQDGAILIYETK